MHVFAVEMVIFLFSMTRQRGMKYHSEKRSLYSISLGAINKWCAVRSCDHRNPSECKCNSVKWLANRTQASFTEIRPYHNWQVSICVHGTHAIDRHILFFIQQANPSIHSSDATSYSPRASNRVGRLSRKFHLDLDRHSVLRLRERYTPLRNRACRSTRGERNKKKWVNLLPRTHYSGRFAMAMWNASRTKWNISWKSQMHFCHFATWNRGTYTHTQQCPHFVLGMRIIWHQHLVDDTRSTTCSSVEWRSRVALAHRAFRSHLRKHFSINNRIHSITWNVDDAGCAQPFDWINFYCKCARCTCSMFMCIVRRLNCLRGQNKWINS